MKERVTSTKKPKGIKRRYAIFKSSNNRLLEKGLFTGGELQNYLNQKMIKGHSYYAIELKGLDRKLTASELKPLENKISKETSGLPPKDLADLKALLKTLKTKPAWEGMIKAYLFDTFLRDKIPLSIWKKIGGKTL